MMANTLFNRVLDNAKTHLPGAIDSALKLELFNVLDEFFQGSSLWREDAEFTAEPGVTEYSIDPDSSNAARIVRLMSVATENDTTLAATMDEPGELVLDQEVSTEQVCTAKVVLTVGEPLDSEGFPYAPTWMIEKYYQGLFKGLLGKMMVQPAKPYTNERMSILHMREFASAIAQARVEAHRAQLHGAQNWRYPRGWA